MRFPNEDVAVFNEEIWEKLARWDFETTRFLRKLFRQRQMLPLVNPNQTLLKETER